jgi:Zn-dependent M28 family amino/carboxypeptidase
MMKKPLQNNIIAIVFTLIVLSALGVGIDRLVRGNVFDGKQAYDDVRTQLAFGPRTPGSVAHQKEGDWILLELADAGWQVQEQTAVVNGHTIRNISASRMQGAGDPLYILGAHYDSRLVADQDQDPAARQLPVPGANDGASGVAVLLGLARALPDDLAGNVWLEFFDAEDQGDLPGWDWILGSSYLASHMDRELVTHVSGVIIVDMVGDVDLTIYKERNSDPALTDAIWSTAAAHGYGDPFQPSVKYQMLDDHLPFKERGIPVVLLIDFDYPWWHTSGDTLDKVSAKSLDAVGTTLYYWLVDALGK